MFSFKEKSRVAETDDNEDEVPTLTRDDENEVDVSNSKHNDDKCSDDDGDKIVCTRRKN